MGVSDTNNARVQLLLFFSTMHLRSECIAFPKGTTVSTASIVHASVVVHVDIVATAITMARCADLSMLALVWQSSGLLAARRPILFDFGFDPAVGPADSRSKRADCWAQDWKVAGLVCREAVEDVHFLAASQRRAGGHAAAHGAQARTEHVRDVMTRRQLAS
eukprot:850035-Pleurochrysis_carterae.AAC.8